MKIVVCGESSTGFLLKDIADDFKPKLGVNRYFRNLPAIPISVGQGVQALLRLALREQQTKQAKSGLIKKYTIDGRCATAHQFMYPKQTGIKDLIVNKITEDETSVKQRLPGIKDLIVNKITEGEISVKEHLPKSREELANLIFALDSHRPNDDEPKLLTELSLDDPDQWTMSWTTFPNVNAAGQKMKDTWVATLTDPDVATEQLWPTMANYGLAYNLMVLQKVDEDQIESLRTDFSSVWEARWDALYDAGKLYMIDFSVFDALKVGQDEEIGRFVPGTVTLLELHDDKRITPVAIKVDAHQKRTEGQVYSRQDATDGAWLYALQAVKTGSTIYGIFLGHLYHWHLSTAAMQMTMYNTLPTEHKIYQLLAPQSNHLIGFDTILLALWNQIAPPTAIDSPGKFIDLCAEFGKNRTFFHDDPRQTIERHGLDPADFTTPGEKEWDLYPIIGHYFDTWDATEAYINTFVDEVYNDNDDLVDDGPLQAWIAMSRDPDGGNIKGLPEKIESKEQLKSILTSLLYRMTMHGGSRLGSDALPAFSFVANYPGGLEKTTIPKPDDMLDTKELLSYLPTTGAIGGMINFYFVFVFSAPYEPFIPLDGVDTKPFFSSTGQISNENPLNNAFNQRLNDALFAYRRDVIQVIKNIGSFQDFPLIHQWPLNIET